MGKYVLSAAEIKAIIAEKFALSQPDIDVLLDITEKRVLVGGRGEIGEYRKITYEVNALIYCINNERAEKNLMEWEKSQMRWGGANG